MSEKSRNLADIAAILRDAIQKHKMLGTDGVIIASMQGTYIKRIMTRDLTVDDLLKLADAADPPIGFSEE